MPLPKPSPTATAVVTGASSGIGADIARELASRGHGVTLVARREDKLRELAAELPGVRVEVIACDVADADARAGLLAEVERRGLTVDILVNNAGIGTMGPVADASVNVGSTAGFHPFPVQAGYVGTKVFVRAYTDAVGAELAGTGVTVATLHPGPVRTGFLQAAGIDERTFADAFPKLLWMPSREVARAGIDALADDRGSVLPGLPSQVFTRLFQVMPRRLLLPLLVKQHPALRRAASRR